MKVTFHADDANEKDEVVEHTVCERDIAAGTALIRRPSVIAEHMRLYERFCEAEGGNQGEKAKAD